MQVVDPAGAIAGGQAGVAGRDQLRAAGLGRGAIDHRLARDRLHRFHRGVYLVGHAVTSELTREWAAVRACGRHAYVDHRSALEIYEIVERRDGPVHIVVTKGCRRSRDGILVHRTRRADPFDFGVFDGILPIVSPARALLDFAEDANPSELQWAINEADIRGLVAPGDLYEILARIRGRRGAKRLTRALERHDGPRKVHEGGERLLLHGLRSARITGYETNATVHGKEVDFWFAGAGLVIEADSGRYHVTPTAVDRDRRKEAFLRSKNLTVLRYSYWQLRDDMPAVIAEIAARLGPAAPA